MWKNRAHNQRAHRPEMIKLRVEEFAHGRQGEWCVLKDRPLRYKYLFSWKQLRLRLFFTVQSPQTGFRACSSCPSPPPSQTYFNPILSYYRPPHLATWVGWKNFCPLENFESSKSRRREHSRLPSVHSAHLSVEKQWQLQRPSPLRLPLDTSNLMALRLPTTRPSRHSPTDVLPSSRPDT